MILGILLITKGYSEDVVGLTRAALQQGHEVNLFMMDDGVFYSQDAQVAGLAGQTGVTLSLCERSCQWRDIEEHMIPDGVTAGSQMQNAIMHNSADRIIVI
jgi:sulfur relay (sulfurtransferase) complex TusBCD TusD component (DsrE family)